MKVLYSVHPEDFKEYSTAMIRERFLIDTLFRPDEISLTYTHYDRMIIGGVMPVEKIISLETYDQLKADYFLERRELGVINVGGPAFVRVGDSEYGLQKLDCLYMGKGNQEVSFASEQSGNPALLYLLSAPAHAVYPTTFLSKDKAESNSLGALATSNQRTIYRYIHKNGIQSCQLVMGLTILETGSVWNTIPPHTHDRRMEAYFYFDLSPEHVVFHYMGEPSETRHILVKNHQAIASPPWSIHAGSGTSNYGFIWGMAGENLEYSDMDGVPVTELQ
jgi:4-deoxy-L-threo-5-hexosulose-uronate ketol-isomerase